MSTPIDRCPPCGAYGPCWLVDEEVSYDSLTDCGKQAVLESGVGKAGQSIVVTSGYPFNSSGSTNTMRVEML